MCRTVADAAALLGVLAGETYGEGSGPDTLRGVRLAVPPEPDDLTSRSGRCSAPPSTCSASGAPSSSRCRALPETDEFPVLCTSSPAISTPTSRRCRRGPRSGPCASSSPGTRRTPTRRSSTARCSWRRPLAVDHEAERRGVRASCAPRPGRGGRARHRRHARGRGRRGDRLPRSGRLRVRGPSRLPEHGRAGRVPPREPLAARAQPVGRRAARDCCWLWRAAYEEAAQVRRPPSVINPSLFRGVGGSPATG